MVRTVKQVVRPEQPEIKIHHRSGACQPRDNLGIACLIQNDSENDKFRCGRRRTLPVPKDNIGISCLPTQRPKGLGDVPEESEHETSEEEQTVEDTGKEIVRDRWGTVAKSKVAGKTKGYQLPKNDQGFIKHRTGGANGDCPVRLHDNKGKTSTSSSNSSTADINVDGSDIRQRNGMYETTMAAGFTKNDRQIGISNIRRPVHDVMQPRKAIVPRDNLQATCRYIQRPVGRSCMRDANDTFNRTNQNSVQKKLGAEKVSPPAREKVVGEHTRTLKSNAVQTRRCSDKIDSGKK